MTTPAGAMPHRTTGSEVLAELSEYAGAQAMVDQLSDGGFPVESVRIIGTGITSVEQVTGRLTNGCSALAGAGSGAWFGLLLGLLLTLFTVGLGFLWIALWSVLLGAVFGAVFGLVAHATSGGRRDFASIKILAAQSCSVTVDTATATAAQARQLLGAPRI